MGSRRLGSWMIAASLLAILLVGTLLIERDARARQARLHLQAQALVHTLSRVPFEQLAPRAGSLSLLPSLLQVLGTDLGYGAVADVAGATVVKFGPIDMPPAAALPGAAEPATWFGERELDATASGRRIREFYGPVLSNGALAGQVRLGLPQLSLAGVAAQQAWFVGLIALPVFLLAPLSYLLVRRESGPLQTVGERLSQLAGHDDEQVAAGRAAATDLHAFLQRLTSWADAAGARMRQLESERFEALMANRMLDYRQQKTDAVLHALPDAVIVLDSTGTIAFANAKVDPILAIDHRVAVGRLAADVVQLPQLVVLLARCQERGHAAQPETIELSLPGAPDRTIFVAARVLLSERDPSVRLGVLVVLRDVTQQRLASQAGAEFVAHVSHELKSPLNVLLMHSELLQSDLGSSDSLRIEAVNVIRDEVERMASLINGLLNISRIEAGTIAISRERVRLHELLRDVFDEVAQTAVGKDLVLDCKLPVEMSALMLDKGLFRIAVSNLLTNAIKYNRPGGTVALRAEESDAHVTIRVRDTGIGIPPEDQPSVFDKFFRSAQATGSGHGLGLYLAREICRLHEGELTLTSELGTGTEFCMVIRKNSAALQEAARL